ncbi:hypothetical protein AKJ16_DCAP08631 [Drosera capensis]
MRLNSVLLSDSVLEPGMQGITFLFSRKQLLGGLSIIVVSFPASCPIVASQDVRLLQQAQLNSQCLTAAVHFVLMSFVRSSVLKSSGCSIVASTAAALPFVMMVLIV